MFRYTAETFSSDSVPGLLDHSKPIDDDDEKYGSTDEVLKVIKRSEKGTSRNSNHRHMNTVSYLQKLQRLIRGKNAEQ
jgi:hypothetical protein